MRHMSRQLFLLAFDSTQFTCSKKISLGVYENTKIIDVTLSLNSTATKVQRTRYPMIALSLPMIALVQEVNQRQDSGPPSWSTLVKKGYHNQ